MNINFVRKRIAKSIGIFIQGTFLHILLDKTRAALYLILSLYYLLCLHLDVYLCIQLKQNLLSPKAGSHYPPHTGPAPLLSELEISLDLFQVNRLKIAKFMFCLYNHLLSPLFPNLLMTNSQIHRTDMTLEQPLIFQCIRVTLT